MMNLDTYLINLPRRSDRRAEAMSEIRDLKLNPELVRVVDAQYSPRNGVIGCAASHAYALSRFLFESDGPWCLVLEDDFTVDNKNEFQKKLEPLLTSEQNWDVLLLASNVAVPTEATIYPNVFRVINSQTASAYIVNRRYAPVLIKEFYESAYLLSETFRRFKNRSANLFYASDMVWKSLQLKDRFYAFLPALAIQRESFSEIENRMVSYGV
jgi:GR25 family glycosyltransferase involved in LPS biosynthesis